MDTGIYYLYEYNDHQKIRNAGFLKIARQEQTCFLQLNVRGLPVTQHDTAKLSAFYMENDSANAALLSDIICGNHNISEKITITETHFPNQYPLNQLDGFFLKLPHGKILAAASPGVTFNTEKIVFLSENASTVPQPENLPPEENQTKKPAPESSELSPAEEFQTKKPAPKSSELSPSEEFQTKKPALESSELSPAEEFQTKKPEPESTTVIQQKEVSSEEVSPTDITPEKPKQTIRKIQRSELSCLPRRYWNLANNSFLLHGYYNYNHLLLVEEDGHYWLGVPGIYDPRESRAAELFGFTQFTDSFNQQLSLTEEECNDFGRFGYWCRYLKL